MKIAEFEVMTTEATSQSAIMFKVPLGARATDLFFDPPDGLYVPIPIRQNATIRYGRS